MLKKILVAALVATMVFGVTSCKTEETEPSVNLPTATTEVKVNLSEDGKKAVAAYKDLLKNKKTSIVIIEKTFGINNCGLFDINSDGIPELFFFAAADAAGYAGNLYVYSYNQASGGPVLSLEVPNLLYTSGGSGEFAVFVAPETLIITRSFGEDPVNITETIEYDMNYKIKASYKYRHSLDSDTERMVDSYFAGTLAIDQATYESFIRPHIDGCTMVLSNNYAPQPEDMMYPIISKPSVNLMNYDSMLSHLIKIG